ncbi:MAG: hypothetical protein U9Q74_05270, partial [Gemmatimonadota bacterium]|nr:hypothetical protein [Gemmatimonadota bacterium]
ENSGPPDPLPRDALRSPTVQRFLEHFYATAGEQRRVDVLRQLSQCLTATGAILEGSERVRAADVDHLDEICSIVMHDPPNDPNLAIRFVLLKLRTTYTETLSARHRGAVPLRRVPSPANGPTRLNSVMAARA